jgi:hypothetical protein
VRYTGSYRLFGADRVCLDAGANGFHSGGDAPDVRAQRLKNGL